VRAALVVVAVVTMGCRSTEAAATAAAAAKGGAWSCGAVHGEARLARRLGRAGRLRVGAVADTNGTSPATLANLRRFAGVFASEHVDVVLALGDLGASEDEIATVLRELRAAGAPVLALAGEREPEGAFHAAVKRAQAAGVDVVDLVDTRLVDAGDVDIVSLPGYPFSAKGCHYTAADLDGVRRLLAGRTRPLLMAAHTPPKGDGSDAWDWALGDGNAGDPATKALVSALKPRSVLCAHVDEAGGRGAGGIFNVGGVEAGMAALLELADGSARTRVLQ
jgi:Icc-related predicted phosphoesterase